MDNVPQSPPVERPSTAHRGLLFTSAFLALATFLASGPLIYALPVLGLALAVVGWRLSGRHRVSTGSRDRTAGRFAIALILAQNVLIVATLKVAWGQAYASAVESSLRSIWHGLEQYHSEHGVYPESLGDLVLGESLNYSSIESQFDPNVGWYPQARPFIYVSFTYRQCSGTWREDRDLILLHDAAAFTRLEERLIHRPGRFVLFADGRVERLDAAHFADALDRDRRLRTSLGWPPDPPDPPVRRWP